MPRPHVTLKLATSLDGRIAMASGESRWITGGLSRAEVQRMRARVDAVMIGSGTARADDPELLARTEPPPPKQPMRVVLDSTLTLPAKGRLFATLDRSPVVVIGVTGASGAALEAAGSRVAHVPAAQGGGVDIAAALDWLAGQGVRSVLAEGGGKLAASLIAAGCVNRLEWMRAPFVLGAEGRPAVAALSLARLGDAPAWKRVALRELGPDLWESYERAL